MNNSSMNRKPVPNPATANVIQINNSNSQSGGGLTTASVILGVIALVISFGGFVPCLGTAAVFLAIPLALIGILLACFASKKVAGLVLGGVALCIATVAALCQGALVGAAAAGSAEAAKEAAKAMEESTNEFNREMKKLEEDIKKSQRSY